MNSNTTIPLLLAIFGLVIGLMAHNAVRRGNARFYALERETLLRRASFLLLASIFLFVSSVGLMAFGLRSSEEGVVDNGESLLASIQPTQTAIAEQLSAQNARVAAEASGSLPSIAVTDQPALPVIDPTATIDPNITPSPVPRRAIIENTGGYGANLRSQPGTNGEEVDVLDEQTLVILIDGVDPINANGFNWIKVRTVNGREGWLADLYLTSTDQ